MSISIEYADLPPAWIAVDLYGTLANTHPGPGGIGEPIPAMIDFVKKCLDMGKVVKIFTARMFYHGKVSRTTGRVIDVVTPVQAWCLKHIGQVLPVTNSKDPSCSIIYDDIAYHVERNTGRICL